MLYEKVLNTIKQKNLIPNGCTVIAAVSGGADSICMLDVLFTLSKTEGFELKAAHLNHNLRGAESDGDEQYVCDICKKYGIPLYRKSVDVSSLSKGKSIEDTARKVRYEFFNEICKGQNAVVATAHNAGDNTETFFINLLRGSGSRGLCAIPSKREGIIRPLLDISRSEILEHLSKKGISYRTDSTNSDTDYLRNFIRHEIIPVFEKRGGINLHKSVRRATENLFEENKVLDKIANEKATNVISILTTFDDAVLYRVVSKMLEDEFDIILDSVHFEAVKTLIKKENGKEQIKNDIYAVCKKGKLYFQKLSNKDSNIYPLEFCENKVGSNVILIKKEKEIYKDLTHSLADCDKISGNLFLRTRKEGDFFTPQNRKCTSKLAKLLKNDGVDTQKRDSLYVICDSENKVVFVQGYGVNAEFAANENSQNIIRIEII